MLNCAFIENVRLLSSLNTTQISDFSFSDIAFLIVNFKQNISYFLKIFQILNDIWKLISNNSETYYYQKKSFRNDCFFLFSKYENYFITEKIGMLFWHANSNRYMFMHCIKGIAKFQIIFVVWMRIDKSGFPNGWIKQTILNFKWCSFTTSY